MPPTRVQSPAPEPSPAPSPESPAESGPERTVARFAAAVEQRRLDDALACLAEDARFVTPDGTLVSGPLQLRGMVRQLLAMPSSVSIEPERTIELGQTALATQAWTLRFQDGDGTPFERVSTATLALRRSRPDWRLTLVAPWGLAGSRRT